MIIIYIYLLNYIKYIMNYITTSFRVHRET